MENSHKWKISMGILGKWISEKKKKKKKKKTFVEVNCYYYSIAVVSIWE